LKNIKHEKNKTRRVGKNNTHMSIDINHNKHAYTYWMRMTKVFPFEILFYKVVLKDLKSFFF